MASLGRLRIEAGEEIIHVTPVRLETGRGWTKMIWGASRGAYWKHPDTQFLITAYRVMGREESNGGLVVDQLYSDYPKDPNSPPKKGIRVIPSDDFDRQNYYKPGQYDLKRRLQRNGLEIEKVEEGETERWRIVRTPQPLTQEV